MADTDTTLVESVLVAIDISKHRHEVLIEIPGHKRRRRLTVLNSREDFDRLVALLVDYGRPVRVAFEATGNYHRALAYHLASAGFELKLISSVGLARTREALHNSWDKNDPKDAQVILHMLQIIPGIGPINALIILAESGAPQTGRRHFDISECRQINTRIRCAATAPFLASGIENPGVGNSLRSRPAASYRI